MFWYIALACATILAAFILPFHIPPTSEAYGQSYVIGFNNRIAILLLLAISLAVLWLQRRSVEVSATDGLVSGRRLGLPWLFSAWLVVSLWIVPTAKLILTHTSRSVEDFTFIPQLEKAFYFHRALYTQIEFAYGPLLFYPTLWLAHLLRFYNGPVNLAYYITLLVHHLVGLALLFYTLNRLPLRCSMRAVLFVLVGIYSLNPLMGLNYTLLRFMAPLASAILIAGLRDRRVAAAVSLVCTVAAFCLSAEVGVALAVGICGLALARMLRGDLRAVLLGVSAAVGTLLTFAFLPKEYFYSLHGFSLGYNNLAILPRPDVLLLLLCLVALAPIVAGRAVWRKHPSASAERVWILYIVALCMVPAALGASESMHVMSSGIGLFLLGGVCVSGWPMPQIAYSALLLIAQTSMLYHHFQGARGRLMVAVRCGVPQAALVSAERLPPPVRGIARSALATTCPAYIDPADLNSSIHGEPFTVPWVTDANVSEHMVRMPNYRPSYFHGLINVWSREQQQRKVDEMRSVRWAVVLGGEQPQQQEPNGPTGFARATHFRARHNVFFDELMSNELRAHWVKVRQVSEGTWLYRRVQ